jgi:hypothetical protein
MKKEYVRAAGGFCMRHLDESFARQNKVRADRGFAAHRRRVIQRWFALGARAGAVPSRDDDGKILSLINSVTRSANLAEVLMTA